MEKAYIYDLQEKLEDRVEDPSFRVVTNCGDGYEKTSRNKGGQMGRRVWRIWMSLTFFKCFVDLAYLFLTIVDGGTIF